jgi:hypothetical protein
VVWTLALPSFPDPSQPRLGWLGAFLAREHDPDLASSTCIFPTCPARRSSVVSATTRGRRDPGRHPERGRPAEPDQAPPRLRAFLTKPLDVAELLALLDQVADERLAASSSID